MVKEKRSMVLLKYIFRENGNIGLFAFFILLASIYIREKKVRIKRNFLILLQ